MPTLPKSALSALNATFSKEQAETLLALIAAVGGSDWDSIVDKPASFPPSAHTHEWEDITDAPEAPTWANLSGKPAVIAAGADAAAARAVIGAGTSNLTIGTTGSTAAAGNHTHDITEIEGLEDTLDALEQRIAALEEPEV